MFGNLVMEIDRTCLICGQQGNFFAVTALELYYSFSYVTIRCEYIEYLSAIMITVLLY